MGFFIAAAIFLLLGIFLAFGNWRKSRTWVPAKAQGQLRKTYVRRDLDGDKILMDEVRFRFEDERGIIHSFDVRDYSGVREEEMQVRVFYDPKNPRRALIDTARDMYGWAAGLILFGVWLLVFGFLSTK